MRNIIVLLFAVLMVVSCKTTKEVDASEEMVPTAEISPEPKPQEFTKKKRSAGLDAEKLAAQLGLSVEQEGPFVKLMNETTEAMQKARIDNKGKKQELIDAMLAVKNRRIQGLESLLTESQMIKYYEIMQVNKGKATGPLYKRQG